MGHLRLSRLPSSQKWRHVVEQLQLGAGVEILAADASDAAETALHGAVADPVFAQAAWLLTQIPLAARADNYVGRLRQLGIEVDDEPGLLEIGAAVTEALDAVGRRKGGRTDLGEMASLSLVESLTELVGRALPGLFTPNAAEVQRELGRYATKVGFSELARDFFARFSRRHLDYYLSRALADHVGVARRFESSSDHTEFNRSLDLHCREASRIIDEYAGAWLSKAQFEQRLTPTEVRGFAAHALRKMAAEFQRRRSGDG